MTDETSNQTNPEQGSDNLEPAQQTGQASQEPEAQGTQASQPEAGQNAQQSGQSSLSNNSNQRSPGAKIKYALLAAAAILFIFCFVLKPWQWFGDDEKAKPEVQHQDVPLTSQQQLRQGTLPEEPSEPAENESELEKKEKNELQLVPEPADEPSLDDSSSYSSDSSKPSLEDLKFQAPMMGGGSTGSSGSASARTDTDTASDTKTQEHKYPTYDEILEETRKRMGVNANGQGSAAFGGSFPAARHPGEQDLESKLQGTPTPVGDTVVNHNRSLMISKGTVIDCILETRLDTTVPGFTSCVIPRDIYSQDGKVLLVERGTKAVGEYRGGVANGLARIFVLWTEFRTPEGVIVSVSSPAADSLGGAGMGGYVDFHWWKRFGNALLFSMVSSAFDFATAKEADNNGDFQMDSSGMNEIIQEAMRQAGNIPPTLYKNQGEHVSVFVARDIDFSNSYQLSLHH